MVCRSRDELIGGLSKITADAPSSPLPATEGLPPKRTAYLFPGAGSHYPSMGRALYSSQPAFAAALERCAERFDLERPLLEVLFASKGSDDAARLDQPAYAYAAIFSVGVALAELWQSFGVRPDAVLGHGLGEITAAHVCGVLSLADGVELVSARARLVSGITAAPEMVSVAAPEAVILDSIGQTSVSIAAVNGPAGTVIAGAQSDVQAVASSFERAGVKTHRLVASAVVAPPQSARAELLETADTIEYQTSKVPLFSTVTGQIADGEICVGHYWADQAFAPVRFAAGVEALSVFGATTFVEVGGRGDLLSLASACLPPQTPGSWLPSLREGVDDGSVILESLGRWYAQGGSVRWPAVAAAPAGRRVPLPTYPFQRQRYWMDAGAAAPSPRAAPVEETPAISPLLSLSWKRLPASEASQAGALAGRFLIVSPSAEAGAQLGASLEAEGGQYALAVLATEAGPDRVDAADPEAVRRCFESHGSSGPIDAVIAWWGEGLLADSAPASATATAIAGLHVAAATAALAEAQAAPPRVYWFTAGSQEVRSGEALVTATSPLWGLGRVWRAEYPEWRGVLVDLPAGEMPNAGAWRPLIGSRDGESELALRGADRYGLRLVGRPAEEPNRSAELTLRADRTYLVTGGVGPLGFVVARWLVDRGAGHVVLLSRRPPAGDRAAAVEALRGSGAQITVAQADVADQAALERVFSAIPAALPLAGLVHAAGVVDDAPIHQQTAARFDAVLAAKVQGTWNLHLLTKALDLDLFVLFSSAASVVGAAGQANYAAANAFLDGLARLRRSEGLVAQSLNWGPWDGEGMASELSVANRARLARQGFGFIDPEVGPRLLQAALSAGDAQLAIVPLDLQRLKKAVLGAEMPSIFRDLVGEAGSPLQSALQSELAGLVASERSAVLTDRLKGEVASVLALDTPALVSATRPVDQLGLDSLMALELRNRVSALVGQTLPASLMFDYPTIEALAAHLLADVLDLDRPAAITPAAQAVLQPSWDEPIAIVGMSCRFPGGVTDLDGFWALLDAGKDAITEVPADRWNVDDVYDPDPDAAGKMMTRCGGFMDDVDQFDAAFFDIAPREAKRMDPQQRLVLEASWEALERAGVAPDRLTGTQTGVFLGLTTHDYESLRPPGLEAMDGYIGIGNTGAIASGRLSYLLGLEGPSLTLDTACSSSLVATHLACQSLRSGESDLALAGGVSLLLTPAMFVEFSRQRGLAADGRCKTFSAAADGTGWSEGCGMLVLERLADAKANGHTPLAVIRGTAVNQDGRSQGLTAPNGPSQQAVIRRALAQAGLTPADVQYVEAHGTGTALGDPIEVEALAAVFAAGRAAESPLLIGAVKSNIGHTIAAAGVAGVIKTVLGMVHGRIPPSLHAAEPSPHIPWSEIPIRVVDAPAAWPNGDRPRIAGVSAFGISGTNAHVVLEAPGDDRLGEPAQSNLRDPATPSVEEAASSRRPAHLVTLSCRSAAALDAQVTSLAAHLARHPDPRIEDVAFTLSTGRAHFEHRRALVCRSTDDLLAQLPAQRRSRAPRAGGPGKVAFLFSGQPGAYADLSRELYNTQPAFAEALDRCAGHLETQLDRPLLEVLFSAQGAESATWLAHSAQFAVVYALSALWQSWGVVPDVVLGHGAGELAAACVSGVLTLPDALDLVVCRGKLIEASSVAGAMVSVDASQTTVEDAIGAVAVSVAAVHGAAGTVISGEQAAVLEVAGALEAAGHKTTRLGSTAPLQSPLMAGLQADLRAAASKVAFGKRQIPLVSTVSGALAGDEVASADYWADQLCSTVRFSAGIDTLHRYGVGTYVEISPTTSLLPLVSQCVPDDAQACLLNSGTPDAVTWSTLLTSLGRFYVAGGAVDWPAFAAPHGGRVVPLPTYPFERRRHWLDTPTRWWEAPKQGGLAHPLLGQHVPLAGKEVVFETRLGVDDEPYLGDHRVFGRIVVPAALQLEMVLAAGEAWLGSTDHAIEEMVIQSALILPGRGARRVQLVFEDAGDRVPFTLSSQPDDAAAGADWTVHAAGVLCTGVDVSPPAPLDLDGLSTRLDAAEQVDGDATYAQLEASGFGFGPAFRCLRQMWRSDGASISRMTLGDAQLRTASSHGLHPALLDSAIRSIFASVVTDQVGQAYLPFEVGSYKLYSRGASEAWVEARVLGDPSPSADFLMTEVMLWDSAGQPLAELRGLRVIKTPLEALARIDAPELPEWLYDVAWKPVETPVDATPELAGSWLLANLGHDAPLVDQVAAKIEGAGGRVHTVASAAEIEPGLVALAGDEALAGVLVFWGAADYDPGQTPIVAETTAISGLEVLQALLDASEELGASEHRRRLWWVTDGAQPVTGGGDLALDAAPLWGLGRVWQQEHPEWASTLVDLEPGADPDSNASAIVGLLDADADSQLALRDGKLLGPRLVRATPSPTPVIGALRQQSTVVITGGLGNLGLLVAKHLVSAHGFRHLLLLGRRPPSEGASEVIEALRSEGATVTVAQVDITDRSALQAVLTDVPESHPLGGVVHAAGVLDDGVVDNQTAPRFSSVLAPKVRGAWNLHELTLGADLGFFVLFSSSASLIGPPGQSNYAAANAFLDALAHQRRASSLPAQSLNWGPWSGAGMAARLADADQARFARFGFDMIDQAPGLQMFDAALGRPEAQLAVLPIDAERLKKAASVGQVPSILAAIVETKGGASRRAAVPKSALFEQLAQMPEERRQTALMDALRERVASVLELSSPLDVPVDKPLQDLGLDSIMAVELRNEVSALAGKSLRATLLFDYPTLDGLSGYMLKDLLPSAEAGRPKVAKLRSAVANDPIAVIGMSCRYPGGATSVEAFWDLLKEGRDAVTEVPKSRFDIDAWYDPDQDAPGKTYNKWGGFLGDLDKFDASFFEISAREAVSVDPQERLLLEVAWEALERSGQTPEKLMGSATGVYVGLNSTDYQRKVFRLEQPELIDAYSGIGTGHCTVVGRLSYWLGLKGPNFPVDTACSSSLVATHLACQSLRSGEVDLAVAGGVNVILSPLLTVFFCRMHALSTHGRCRAFDAAGDGFVRSEGAGAVVLKRLSDAKADGDPILALVRGSAVNQDGRSQGFSAPNGPSQEAVISMALEQAGVAPAEVGFVEGHGTGTALGDPIEVQALGTVLGEGRAEDNPVMLGSVKSNIGHAETAGGLAGLIKAVLALQHAEVPKSLHFDEPNPYIPWDELPVKVAKEALPWPSNGGRRVAGVSSFGVSGTNAHIVLEEAPQARPRPSDSLTHVVTVSAQQTEAVAEFTERMSTYLAKDDAPSLSSVAYTSTCRRAHRPFRVAVLGADSADVAAGFEAASKGVPDPRVISGKADVRGKVVFVFPGQGAQWAEMGRALIEQAPEFAEALAACDAALMPHTGWSVRALLMGEGDDLPPLDRLDVVQPTLFAVMVSLAALWRAWGVVPDAVVGHSQGEIAAACVSGALSLEDAALVAARRSQILQRVAGKGGMAVVELSMEETAARLVGLESRLSVAVVNSANSTVISGDPDALDALLERLTTEDIFCRRVNVDYASHSPQMDPLRDDILEALSSIQPKVGEVPLYSTVTGERLQGDSLDGAYWVDNLRQTVQFGRSIEQLVDDSHRFFVEVSPHPLLTLAMSSIVEAPEVGGFVGSSLRRDEGGRRQMLVALSQLYVRGYSVDWSKQHPAAQDVVPMPTYPFQRERYWVPGDDDAQAGAARGRVSGGHPLLGPSFSLSTQPGARHFERTLSLSALPYLKDHRVEETVILPGAASVEMAVAAAKEVLGTSQVAVADIAFKEPLLFLPGDDPTIQLSLTDEGGGVFRFQLARAHSGTSAADLPWVVHVTGVVKAAPPIGALAADHDPAAIRARCADTRAPQAIYEALSEHRMQYGPAFQGLTEIGFGPGEAWVRIEVPEAAGSTSAYTLHPALLDSCFQSLGAAGLPEGLDASGPAVVAAIRDLRVYADPGDAVWCHATVAPRPGGAAGLLGTLTLFDDAGAVLVVVEGLEAHPLEGAPAGEPLDEVFFEIDWRAAEPLPSPQGAGRWLLLGDGRGLADQLEGLIADAGGTVVRTGKEAFDPLSAQSVAAAVDSAYAAAQSVAGVVLLSGLDTAVSMGSHADAVADDPIAASAPGWAGALHLSQALAAKQLVDVPRLVLVTANSQAARDGDAVDPHQTTLWGLGSTLFAEQPAWRCLRVDVSEPGAEGEASALVAQMLSAEDEDQILLRGEQRYLARLIRRRTSGGASEIAVAADGRPYRLEVDEPGVLDHMSFRPVERTVPGPGQVEIAVEAAGLNFLDVLKALGIGPGADPADRGLGGEFAGRVVTVGDGVTELAVGDAVMGLAPDSFASHVTVPTYLAVKRPEAMAAADAAAMPVVFATAWYALYNLARLEAKERVLIHSATGGTGLAAIQLARRVGAEVFATAGSDEKREMLRAMGIEHVMDSRSLSFADEIMEATGGEGVDVVLNSLAGLAIEKGLACLRPDGRFLELGKRDIYEDRALTLLCFKKRLSYHAVDLRGMAAERPERVQRLLEAIAGAAAAGEIEPPLTTVHPIGEVGDLLRAMARAQHKGKLVVTTDDPSLQLMVPRGEVAGGARADGTYLITGGLGALGLSVAQWLAERGAGHLLLVGRSGVSTDDQRDAIAAIEAAGARVTVGSADVADRPRMAALLAAHTTAQAPLRGVVHAAGVLDDGVITEQSVQRFHTVMASKVAGAWNLHRLTADAPLDFFVLYSSVVSVLAAPGQGNYAAANAFLDGLAHHRRALGLPACAINWGPFSEVGLAAAQENRASRLATQGMLSLTRTDGLEVLTRLIDQPPAQVCAMLVNVAQWLDFNPSAALWPYVAEIVAEAGQASLTGDEALLASFREATPRARRMRVMDFIRGEVATVLRLDPSRVELDTPLMNLGIDSLMGLELRNRLDSNLGLALPTTLVWTYPTIEALAGYVIEQLELESPAVEAPPEDAVPDTQEEERLEDLSSDELADELEKLL